MTSTVRRSFTALALVTAVGGFAAPAAAAPGEPSDPGKLLQLSYSPTGPWADNLSAPLFTMADGPLVPGDAVPKTFYVFGTPGTKANLRLTCTIEGTSLFAQRLGLEYRVGSGQFRSCEDDHDAFEVTGRKSQQVDVRMMFESLEEGQAGDMNQSASYSITVTLSQVPPKGGGKPQVLGVQTLAAPESVDAVSTVTSSESTASGSTASGSNDLAAAPSGNKGKAAPAKTVNAAATLPDPNVSLRESVPLIGGLLISGALLAGWRRRRREAE